MSHPTTSQNATRAEEPAQDAGQTLTSYPPKPEGVTHFQRDYGYQPATVIRWEWSTTFGRWTALVKFEDGSERFTWPKPYPHIAKEPSQPASAPQAHTPGPWYAHYFPHGAGLVVVTNPPTSHCERFTGQVIASQTTCPNWEANARLIASAPALLEALNRLQANPNDPRAHRQALTTIARATLSTLG